MGVDLALSELTGTDTLVRGTVLLETAVLWIGCQQSRRKDEVGRRCIPVGL
jgi:hypothetical protein